MIVLLLFYIKKLSKMQSESWCRTEKVTKYNCSPKNFELLKVSVPLNLPVGRLREAECLLD